MNNVRKILDISNAHLPDETFNLIESGNFRKPAWIGSYGYMFTVPEQNNIEGDLAIWGVTCSAFAACCQHARNLDCDYILFDRDSDTNETLQVFDW